MGCKKSDMTEHKHTHVAKWLPQKGKSSPIRKLFSHLKEGEREQTKSSFGGTKELNKKDLDPANPLLGIHLKKTIIQKENAP